MAALRGKSRDGEEISEAPRVLIAMTEAMANLVTLTLRHGRYETKWCVDPNEFSRLVRDWRPKLGFIDIDLYERFIDLFGRGLSHGQPPLLCFTRKRDTSVKLSAFERGADDIVEVPFTLDEIVARPFALIRRAYDISVPLVPRLRLSSLEVDLVEQKIRIGGKELELTPIQQTLLYLLAANSGKVLSREELLSSIWGGEFEIESNVVDRHIRELRVKLGDDWRTPMFIETVPGRGYRFRSQVAVSDAAN
ncbi:MAG: response regulator transcription factor [Chloroflexi bacterium]|nr:MAG: response regulator transcription factor [Chloroflexota bacterium]